MPETASGGWILDGDTQENLYACPICGDTERTDEGGKTRSQKPRTSGRPTEDPDE